MICRPGPFAVRFPRDAAARGRGRAGRPVSVRGPLRRVEARMGRESRFPATKAVLIPLGRSLQRNSAAPDYFASPRAVVAAVAEPAGTGDLYLKDRLYLGYQEKANLLEVISYNEDAGRFEFQVVTDYRPGGTPRIAYANRTLCVACHQNAAPIFSRAVWDETNANPRVAALLAAQRKDFHGIPVDRGVDVPNAIDDATLRANGFAAYQLLWNDGCGGNDLPAVTCRAGLFAALLQYRLSGQQQFDRADASYRDKVAARVSEAARLQWPGGLAIGNPDLPNRNPVPAEAPVSPPIAARDGAGLVEVAAAFDPLLPRPPLEVWRVAGPDDVARLVIGLADFIAESDVERLDAALIERAQALGAARRTYRAACKVDPARTSHGSQRVEFRCTSSSTRADRGVTLEGRVFVAGESVSRGTIDRLEIDGQPPLRDLDLDAGRIDVRGAQRVAVLTPLSGHVHARGADGNALLRLELRWGDRDGTASLVVLDDFASARNAIDTLVRESLAGKFDGFDALAFRRARLMPALLTRLGAARRGVVLPRRLRHAVRSRRTRRQYGSAAARASNPSPPPRTPASIAIARNAISARNGRHRISCSGMPTKWRPRSGTARRGSTFDSACGAAHLTPAPRPRCRRKSHSADSSSRTPRGAMATRCRASCSRRTKGCKPKRATDGEAKPCCARATKVCARACRTSPPQRRRCARRPTPRPHNARRRSTDNEKGPAWTHSAMRNGPRSGAAAFSFFCSSSWPRCASSGSISSSVSAATLPSTTRATRSTSSTVPRAASTRWAFRTGSGERSRKCARSTSRVPGTSRSDMIFEPGKDASRRHLAAPLPGRGSRVPQLRGLPYQHGAHRKGQGASGRVRDAGEQLRHHEVPEILLRLRSGSTVPQGIRDGGNRPPRCEPRLPRPYGRLSGGDRHHARAGADAGRSLRLDKPAAGVGPGSGGHVQFRQGDLQLSDGHSPGDTRCPRRPTFRRSGTRSRARA